MIACRFVISSPDPAVCGGADAMSASMKKPKSGTPPPALKCQDVRAAMLAASVVQLAIAIVIVIVGATQMGVCDADHFADWSMVYGGFLFGCSAVITAAVHGRQRQVVLAAIVISSLACVIALGIDGTSYFCVDLRGGVNRVGVKMCKGHIEEFNSCHWVSEYRNGDVKGLLHDNGDARITALVLIIFYLSFGVGIMTTALTEAGREDLCQFEEALREMKEMNETLDYRKRAARNRILTKYITEAKPEEGQGVGTKVMRFFGFGTDVEPIPVENRKVKFTLPKGAPPSTRSELPE